MARKKSIVPVQRHARPRVNIDWDLVDQRLSLGCEGTEVAAALGISADALYERCKTDRSMLFSDLLRQKRANGIECEIRKAQSELIKDKVPSIVIFLGKVYLKQRELDPENSEKTKAALIQYLDSLDKKND